MAESWIEIRPGGYLKKYGNHKFFVSSPKEALKAMFMQMPKFRDAFEASTKKGLGFAIVTDKRTVKDLDELAMGKPQVVKIIPKQMGRKGNNGLTQIFAAIAIVVAIFFPPAGLAAAGWFAAGSTSLAIATSLAISLALGGITAMLTPQPEGITQRTDPENKASYAFGGVVNTTAQGNPIPVFYGKRQVGGAIISASIRSEDQT